MEHEFHFHVSDVFAIVGGLMGIFGAAFSYLIKRTIFGEIDSLKVNKQDKAMCNQIEGVAQRDRAEMKNDLKDGKREFKYLHRKIDMILFKMHIPPVREEEEEDINGDRS